MPFAYEYRGATLAAQRCGRCALVFLGRQPTPTALERLYSAAYFTEDYRCGHADRCAFDGDLAQRGDDTLFAQIARHMEGRRLVELGPAGGDFLVAARTRGYDVTGVELSAAAAAAARARFGLDVRAGTLSDAGLSPQSVDIVYMGDVLEHVPNPLETLRDAHRLLRANGLLVVAGPTTINSLARRAGLAWYRARRKTKVLTSPPYHLWEFTPSTLRALVECAGFGVRDTLVDKIPPTMRVGDARGWERYAQWIADAVNVWVTRVSRRCGDRCILFARKTTG